MSANGESFETRFVPSGFRVSRVGLLVPIIEFDFGGPEKGAIAELRWGPTSTPGLAKLSLEAYANFLGYKNLEFEGSKISLRF